MINKQGLGTQKEGMTTRDCFLENVINYVWNEEWEFTNHNEERVFLEEG